MNLNHDELKNKKGKNLTLLAILIAMIVLLYFVTVVKLSG
jgi:hypothetical protein